MLHPVLEDAFESLLTTWRHYDDVSTNRSAFQARARTRRRLDQQRRRVHRLRRALHPEVRELEDVAFSAHCPSLDAPVFLRRTDLLDDSGAFICPCGATVGPSAG